jgi:hypothetical protein
MRFAVMQEITLLIAAIALTVAGSLSETTPAPSPTPASLETAAKLLPQRSHQGASFLVQKLHRGDRKLKAGSGTNRVPVTSTVLR